MDEWETSTGLTREEFIKFTRYCNQADNIPDNINRAKAAGIESKNVKLAPGAIIKSPDTIRIGKNCFIGLYAYLFGRITVGENVLIGPHCSVSGNNHVFNPETQSFSKSKPEPIVIGDGCWLAAGAMVTAGVTVGKCNLICANAVVTKNTPDYAIMAGTPARQVGRIDPETGEYHWFEKSSGAGDENRREGATP